MIINFRRKGNIEKCKFSMAVLEYMVKKNIRVAESVVFNKTGNNPLD